MERTGTTCVEFRECLLCGDCKPSRNRRQLEYDLNNMTALRQGPHERRPAGQPVISDFCRIFFRWYAIIMSEDIRERQMRMTEWSVNFRPWIGSIVTLALVVAVGTPVEAEVVEPLFDKFSFKAEFSWVALSTEVRLDSDLTEGSGTTLNFEDDLNLGSSKSIPSLDFEWQIGKRHRIAGRWQDISRDSTAQALTDIQWGDETIPIDATVGLGFDITQFFLDYTYYPWVKERWAAGFGLGIRVMDIGATLAWELGGIEHEGSSDVKGTGPLPYLYFEYRAMLSDHWRFIGGIGWLDVTIEDISGGQWIGRASFEYLLGKTWSIGGAGNLATIDVDWAGLKDSNDDPHLNGSIKMDINDFSLFARVRF